jgi:hypothetical protein
MSLPGTNRTSLHRSKLASSPAEFRAFIKDETERLGRVIRGANIQLD